MVSTCRNEEGMSDSPKVLEPKQPCVPDWVEVNCDVSFIKQECLLPESVFNISVENDAGISDN